MYELLDLETKLKHLEAESANYQTMLANMTEEHNKYNNRLEQVNDHKYILALREEIENTKGEAKVYDKYLHCA